MAIAIEDKTRKILSIHVGNIVSSRSTTEKSLKKYGKRTCERSKVLEKLFQELQKCCAKFATIKSDESFHYPRFVKKHFPDAQHKTYKGRRAAPHGLGELKEGGYDPLFFLNHTNAMFRDNLKRLSRRTWCTTKKKARLEDLMNMYAWSHNTYLDRPGKLPIIIWESMSN